MTRKPRTSRRPSSNYSKTNKRKLKKLISQTMSSMAETKEKVLDATSTIGLGSVSSGGLAYGSLDTITQGVSDDQRIGNSIFLRGARFYFPIQNGDNHNHFRLILAMPHAYTRYPLGGTVNNYMSDLFGTNSFNMYSPINTDKYKVFYDKTILLRNLANDGNSTTANPDTRLLQKFFKINKKIQYEYDAPSGFVKPTTELILYAISDSIAVSHPGALGGFLKLYYKDI